MTVSTKMSPFAKLSLSGKTLSRMFAPVFARYEGVRPINIYGLRLFYFLMAAFVATDAWTTLVLHRGDWNPTRVLMVCVWASYPTLALLGLMRPLRMLPLMMFTVMYKSLWLAVVAYPLWRAGTLAGSPAEEMTGVFLWTPLLVLTVPWGYVYREYVRWPRGG